MKVMEPKSNGVSEFTEMNKQTLGFCNLATQKVLCSMIPDDGEKGLGDLIISHALFQNRPR